MKGSILFIFLTLIALSINAQNYQSTIGTDFWMAFTTRISFAEGDPWGGELPVLSLQLTSFDESASVEIDIVHKNWSITRNLSPFRTKDVVIPYDLVEILSNGEIEQTGISIKSTNPIQVVASVRGDFASDVTEIFPTELIGQSYMILMQMQTFDAERSKPEIIIVATEDETEVNIHPNAMESSGLNEILSILLNKGEVYQFFTEGDLSGTEIHSCQPIAVFSGNPATDVPENGDCEAADKMWTQLPPSNYWGKTFAFLPYTYSNDDYESIFALKVVAKYDNTDVKIDDNFIATIDRGEFHLIENWNEAGVISANHPILVGQMPYGGECIDSNINFEQINGDPSLLILTPLDSWHPSAFFRVPENDADNSREDFANIILKAEDVDSFFLSTVPLIGVLSLEPFPNNDSLVWINVPLERDKDYFTSAPKGVGVTMYGMDWYESYHFNLSYQLRKEELFIMMPDTNCLQEAVTFDFTGASSTRWEQVIWDFGDGTFSNEINPVYVYSNTGEYTVSLQIIQEDCNIIELSKDVVIEGTETPNFLITGDLEVNPFDTFLYSIPILDNSTYEWTVSGGQIIDSSINRDSVWIVWENNSEGELGVLETTKEFCLGSQDLIRVDIETFDIDTEGCFPLLKVMQNPVVDNVIVLYKLPNETQQQINVFNASGQLMLVENPFLFRGEHQLSIDVSAFAAGVYFIRFKGDNGCEELLTFVKIRY